MRALIPVVDRAASGLALLGAIGIAAILVQVSADVISRYLFNAPVPATLEMVSRYYMIAIAFFPLAWVERRNEMVTVEVLSGLYGPRGVRRIDTVVSIFAAAIYAVLAYTTMRKAMAEYQTGSFVLSLTIAVPIWPSYFVLPIAFAFAAVVSLVRAVLLAAGHSLPHPGFEAPDDVGVARP